MIEITFDLFDDDGYPTEEVINYIEEFPWQEDYNKFLDFIRQLWSFSEWGWEKGEPEVDYYTSYGGVPTKRTKTPYRVSTAGWSGNEMLVAAMERNIMFWNTTWVSSRRGGHYEFEITVLEDAE